MVVIVYYFKMPSVFSPSNILFAASLLVTLTSALPFRNTIDNTPVGLSDIYTELHTDPILPREQNSNNEHVDETIIWTEHAPRLPRTVDKDGKAEVWVEAQFDSRA